MTELVFTVLADANVFASSADSRLGYPKNGVDVGGGVHVSTAQGRTFQHAAVVKHPTLSLWRYPWDAVVQGEVGKGLTVPVTATPTVLDATWFP